MQIKTSTTYQIELFLSGPVEVAKQILRRKCYEQGMCVTIEPTTFIYTGGEEAGYKIGLLNYPRFPKNPKELKQTANELLHLLIEETHQHSGLMVSPEETIWITRREGRKT